MRVRLVVLLPFLLCPSAAWAADPPDPGRTESGSYTVGLAEYPYLVYTPTTYAPNRPLLVMVHGCQTTAEQQMRANLFNPIAEREGFAVLYPDVDVSATLQPGPLARCWRFFHPAGYQRDSPDPTAIAGMTRDVIARLKVDPERVYLMGMSAGGFMTSILSATYPELYAAVGISAAGAYFDGECLFSPQNPGTPVEVSAQLAFDQMGERARVVPRMLIGGDMDGGIPPHCQDKALEQGLRTNNLVLSGTQEAPLSLTAAASRDEQKQGGYSYSVKTWRDPDGCVVAERWTVHGMDHFWSGGTTDPKYANFTDPKGPSAAEAGWAFLSRFRRPDTSLPCAESPRPASVAATTCSGRTVSVSVPRGARAIRAKVDGRRATVRRRGRRARIKVPAGRPGRVRVVVRFRRRSGRAVVVRRSYNRCVPSSLAA